MNYLLTQLSIHGSTDTFTSLAERYGDGGGHLHRGYDWSPDVVWQDLQSWRDGCLTLGIGTLHTCLAAADPHCVAASFAAAHPELSIEALIYWSTRMPPLMWVDKSLHFVDSAIYIGGQRYWPEDDVDELYA